MNDRGEKMAGISWSQKHILQKVISETALILKVFMDAAKDILHLKKKKVGEGGEK